MSRKQTEVEWKRDNRSLVHEEEDKKRKNEERRRLRSNFTVEKLTVEKLTVEK